jgi:hypothetical protein
LIARVSTLHVSLWASLALVRSGGASAGDRAARLLSRKLSDISVRRSRIDAARDEFTP